MNLDTLYMQKPAGGVRGRFIVEAMPPENPPLTEKQLAQRRVARLKQIEQPKAANGVRR